MLQGPDSHYGTKGLRKITLDCPTGGKVTFLYTYAAGNNNGTSVEDGQIPEIIFYTWNSVLCIRISNLHYLYRMFCFLVQFCTKFCRIFLHTCVPILNAFLADCWYCFVCLHLKLIANWMNYFFQLNLHSVVLCIHTIFVFYTF